MRRLGVRLGDLAAVGGEPGAQRAVPGDDRAQRRLQPVEYPSSRRSRGRRGWPRCPSRPRRRGRSGSRAGAGSAGSPGLRPRHLAPRGAGRGLGQVADQLGLDRLDPADQLGVDALRRPLQPQVRAGDGEPRARARGSRAAPRGGSGAGGLGGHLAGTSSAAMSWASCGDRAAAEQVLHASRPRRCARAPGTAARWPAGTWCPARPAWRRPPAARRAAAAPRGPGPDSQASNGDGGRLG